MDDMDDFGPPPTTATATDGDDPFGLGPPPASIDGFGGAAPPLGGDEGLVQPAADPLPTFGEAEPLPTFGDAEPTPLPTFGDSDPMPMPESTPMPAMAMPAMGGLSDEFTAPAALGPLAKWRIEQQEKVAAKAATAETAMAERLAAAQAAIQTFYDERSESTGKRATANREAEARYIEDRDAAMVADSWASVCGLIDLSKQSGEEKPKEVTFDTSRMRQVLVQLKHS